MGSTNVSNTGSVDAYVKLGTSNAVAATTSDTLVAAGTTVKFTTGANTYFAAITASGSTSLSAAGVSATYTGGLTVTTSEDIYVKPNTILQLGTSKVFGRIANTQPAGLAGASTPIKLEYPIRQNDGTLYSVASPGTFTSVGRINAVKNASITNSGWFVGDTNASANGLKFEEGEINVEFKYDSFRAGNFLLRNDTANFDAVNFAVLDSFTSGYSSGSPHTIGTTFDNNQSWLTGSLPTSSNSQTDLDITSWSATNPMIPANGTKKTIGSRVPITVPFDYANQPRTSGCSVGMLC